MPEPAADALLGATVGTDPVRASRSCSATSRRSGRNSRGEERGIAVVLGEDAPFAGPFFTPFALNVAGAPWLTQGAVEFVAANPPGATAAVAAPSFRRFATSYVTSLKQARRRIETLATMLPAESTSPERLDTMLLLAEARQFLAESEIGKSSSAVHRAFRIMNDPRHGALGHALDRSGQILVTVSNDAAEALSFSVRLKSEALREQPSEDLELAPSESETISLQAEMARRDERSSTSRCSPSGRVIEQQRRSCAAGTTASRS